MKKKSTNTNKKVNTMQSIEQMKYEIANELGVSLGAESTSKDNGAVGGEITKRLVQMGSSKLNKSNKSSK